MAQIDWGLLNTNAPAQIAGAFTQGMDAETARQNALVERAYLAKKRQMEEDASVKAIAEAQRRQNYWTDAFSKLKMGTLTPQEQALTLKGGPTIFTSELAKQLQPKQVEPDLTPIAMGALQFPEDRPLAIGILDKETARHEKEQQALRDIQAKKLLDPKEAWRYTKTSREKYAQSGNVADLEYDTETVKKVGGGGGVAGQSIVYGADGNIHLVNRYTGQITPTGLPAAQYSAGLKGQIESGKEQGKLAGQQIAKAVAEAPYAEQTVQELQTKMDGLLKHPGFKQSVGMGIPGLKYVPGTDAAGFNARFAQLEGGIFLRAFETLKGGGQITNIEGQKATQAMSAMSTATSEAEFNRAAAEFMRSVKQGAEKIKARATQGIGGFKPVSGVTVPVKSEQEALSLPSGTRFQLPDGRTGTAR